MYVNFPSKLVMRQKYVSQINTIKRFTELKDLKLSF